MPGTESISFPLNITYCSRETFSFKFVFILWFSEINNDYLQLNEQSRIWIICPIIKKWNNYGQ